MQVQNGFIRDKERHLNSLKIYDCRAFKPIRISGDHDRATSGRGKTKDWTGRKDSKARVFKLGIFLRGPLHNKNVLQTNQAQYSRIWCEFPQFRLLGFGVILRHRIIPPIQFLRSPDYNFMYHLVLRVWKWMKSLVLSPNSLWVSHAVAKFPHNAILL